MGPLLLALLVGVGAGQTPPGLPDYFPLPAGAESDAAGLVVETYGEGPILRADGEPEFRRGRHVAAALQLPGVDDATAAPLWEPFRASLAGAGWTVVASDLGRNPAFATLRYQRGGKDAWATLTLFGAGDIRLELVEAATFTPTLALRPPAATPEQVGPDQPFPYLPPPPGSAFESGADDGEALLITMTGEEEPTLISEASVSRFYSRPEGVSSLQFVLTMRDALTKAGWRVVGESQSPTQSDALVGAHYARGQRDLWALLHYGAGIEVQVADLGGVELAEAFGRECRVALHGVTFDFNKATLRPDAEPALERALALLQAEPDGAVEVEGHTDNVGGDAPNLTLSQARADAVKVWLVGKGVPAARLTTRGYGRARPVADNDTPEGRARNRRVELSKTGC